MANILVKKYAAEKKPTVTTKRALKPAPRKDAAIEAERGEVVVGDFDYTGVPSAFIIGGQPHSNGGAPINPPDKAFIFSKSKDMKIEDRDILQDFKKSPNGSYTPADLAKQYDINYYRKILADPDTDKVQKKTAKMMIENYNNKLGKLALVQEAHKGFPDEIPFIATPYLTSLGMNPSTEAPVNGVVAPAQTDEDNKKMMKHGGGVNIRVKALPKAGGGKNVDKLAQLLGAEENAPFVDAIYNEYKKSKPKNVLSRPDFVNTILNAQNHVYSLLEANQGKLPIPEGKTSKEYWDQYWDKSKKSNQAYNAEISKLGLNPMNEDQIAAFQQAARTVFDLGKKGIKPAKGALALAPFGVHDNDYKGAALSNVNGWFGNTTGETILAADFPDMLPSGVPKLTQLPPKSNQNPIQKQNVNYTQTNAPKGNFWTQDMINLFGAAGDDLRIKNHLPWQAGYQTVLPTPTFYDPTRELAANAEQANIAEQALASYAGPQAMSSRLSEIQGKALENSANIISRYNNQNVGVANEFSVNAANTLNQDSQNRAAMATGLFDKTTIANQQFENAKAQAREKLRTAFNTAWTNRGKTQALNSMNRQYNVDPITGYVKVTGVPGNIEPTSPHDLVQNYHQLMSEFGFGKDDEKGRSAVLDYLMGAKPKGAFIPGTSLDAYPH